MRNFIELLQDEQQWMVVEPQSIVIVLEQDKDIDTRSIRVLEDFK